MAPGLEVAEEVVQASDTTPDPAATTSPAEAQTQETADAALTPDAETVEPSQERLRGPDGKFIGPEGEPGQETAPAEAEPTLDDYPPFTFQAEGQKLPYDGAVQDDEGNVLFTPQAVQQLQQDLAYARSFPRYRAETQRDLSRERSARQAAETTVQTVMAKLEQLFDASQTASTWEEFAQTPLGQWIVDRHVQWPKLRAEGLQKGFDQRARAMEDELNSFRGREVEAQQRPIMLSRVEEAVKTWGKEAGLNETEQARLIRRYQDNNALEIIFPRAQQDDPVTGLRAGQRYENLEVIRQDLLAMYEVLKNRPAQTAATVAAENARRTGKAGQQAPPTPGVGRGSKPAAEKQKQYKSTREADQDIWS